MKDGHGDDINSTFSIASSTNNARFSDDGKRLITSGPGNIQLKLQWDDNPKKYGVAVDKITVGGVVLDQRGEKGRTTYEDSHYKCTKTNPPPLKLKNMRVFSTLLTM